MVPEGTATGPGRGCDGRGTSEAGTGAEVTLVSSLRARSAAPLPRCRGERRDVLLRVLSATLAEAATAAAGGTAVGALVVVVVPAAVGLRADSREGDESVGFLARVELVLLRVL